MIQSLSELEWLKDIDTVPIELVQAMERDFLDLYESENENVYLMDFCLTFWEALILLESGDHVFRILDNLMSIEYVEKYKEGRIEYYRITKRNDNKLQFIYSLVGIHDEKTERFLKEQVEWNEGFGDY